MVFNSKKFLDEIMIESGFAKSKALNVGRQIANVSINGTTATKLRHNRSLSTVLRLYNLETKFCSTFLSNT